MSFIENYCLTDVLCMICYTIIHCSGCKTADEGDAQCTVCTDVGSSDTTKVACTTCDAGYILDDDSTPKKCLSE